MTLKKELHEEIGRLEEETYALKTAIASALADLKHSQFSVLKELELKVKRDTKIIGYPDEQVQCVIKGVRRAVRTLGRTS